VDGFTRLLALALRIQELVAGVAVADFSAPGPASEGTGEVTGDEGKLSSADTVACGKGVPVDNGLRRRRGFEVTTGFSPCAVASGVDEIVGVGVAVGDKIGVSVAVGVTLASGCAVLDLTGLGVAARFVGVGVFSIAFGPSAGTGTSV
jgi:hypothetical protein